MSNGEFTTADRAAILESTHQRCAGCGTSRGLNIHHRRPRGMGGTRTTMTPAHGLALCGSGTTGCHGWAESHRDHAFILGWLLGPNDNAAVVPWWSRTYGWRQWIYDPPTPAGPGAWLVTFTDPDTLTEEHHHAAKQAAEQMGPRP